jgi:hypothetical protein
MSSFYKLDPDSVITSVFATKNFLTCGGTNNDTPRNGQPWNNFTVNGPFSFKFIFNSSKFSTTSRTPLVKGYPSGNTPPTYIKNFLHNGTDVEYICGKFSLTTPTRNNIMYFNPTISNVSGNDTYGSLSNISFGDPTNDIVNSMAFQATNKNRIFIAGSFLNATISATSSGRNIALINKAATTFTIVNTIPANAIINDSATIINSMIVIGNFLYVAGSYVVGGITKCLFFRYTIGGTTAAAWINLLGNITTYDGTINVIIETVKGVQIAIGGSFTNLGTPTVCNNIVNYTIKTTNYTPLGVGVDNTGLTSPWGIAQVFALTYFSSKRTLWVGGYFYNGGGSVKNSIATVNLDNNVWGEVKKKVVSPNVAPIGLEYFDDAAKPGVVYSFGTAAIDTAIIIVGGSFKTVDSVNNNQYNLVKITIATPTSNNITQYNIGSIFS